MPYAESTRPQQDLSRDSQHETEESKDGTSTDKAAEGEQVADGTSVLAGAGCRSMQY